MTCCLRAKVRSKQSATLIGFLITACTVLPIDVELGKPLDLEMVVQELLDEFA
jgi:hypothetical protein